MRYIEDTFLDKFAESLSQASNWNHEVLSGMGGKIESWYSKEYEFKEGNGHFFIDGRSWGVHVSHDNGKYSRYVYPWWKKMDFFDARLSMIKERIKMMKHHHSSEEMTEYEKGIFNFLNKV